MTFLSFRLQALCVHLTYSRLRQNILQRFLLISNFILVITSFRRSCSTCPSVDFTLKKPTKASFLTPPTNSRRGAVAKGVEHISTIVLVNV